jgi:aminopeptidase N
VDWTANFIAASWGGQIYVIKENFDPWNLPNAEATFVHELTHIWQPNLGSADSFDMDKARTALVEGHANYMGEYYVNQSKAHASVMATVDQVPVFCFSTSAASDLHPMIDTSWDLNYFPYDQGKTFVNTLYDAGGWAKCN